MPGSSTASHINKESVADLVRVRVRVSVRVRVYSTLAAGAPGTPATSTTRDPALWFLDGCESRGDLQDGSTSDRDPGGDKRGRARSGGEQSSTYRHPEHQSCRGPGEVDDGDE